MRRLYQMQTGPVPVVLYDTADYPFPPKISFLSYPLLRKSTLDVLNEMEVTQPAAILYTEPLLDMPARWEFTATEPGLRRKRDRITLAAISSQEAFLLNLVALTTPPDTTPLFVGKMLDMAGELWKGLRDRRTEAAITAGALRGVPSFLVPFTAYTCTVEHILSEIQRHMLEPTIDGGVSWQIWEETEVVHYLRERIARFLLETGLVQDRDTITTIAAQKEYDLPTTLAELKRVALSGSGLFPMDYWQADHGKVGWDTTTGTPYGYLENVDQLSVELVPSPTTGGETLTIHMVKSTPFDRPGPTASNPENLSLAETLATYKLRLPGVFCWTIKYGVMADMLKKEGEANDPQRAEWCEQRFRDGVEIGKLLVGYPLGGGR